MFLSYPNLIGISSNKMGAGKDTVALRLADYGYRSYGFGTSLKEEVRLVLNDREYRETIWDSMPETLRSAVLTCLAMGELDPFQKPTLRDMRTVLQLWGTEFRRAQDPDYWVRAVLHQIEKDHTSKAVVTDVRFPNEFGFIRSRGGESWYVYRENDAYGYAASATKHASEGQLDYFPHDFVLFNRRGIQDLWSLIDMRMGSYGVNPGAEAQGCSLHQ